MRRHLVLGIGLIMAAAACSDDTATGGGGANPGANEVFMQNTAFNPNNRTVTAGTQITFTNRDGIQHNITSSSVPVGAATFASGNLNTNATFQVTPTVPGTYAYFCSIHGTATTGMHATLTVN